MVLHDWSDEDCVRSLSTIRRASSATVRLFIAGVVIPGPIEPHFAKLLDVHMMCVQSGPERTADEYAGLLSAAGWRYTGTLHPPEGLTCVMTAVST
jgi:hypothetical protein